MDTLIYYACFHDECDRYVMRVYIKYMDDIFQISFWKNNEYETYIINEFSLAFELSVFNTPMRIFLSGNKIAGYGKDVSFYGFTNNGNIDSFMCMGCREHQCNQLAHTCLMNE